MGTITRWLYQHPAADGPSFAYRGTIPSGDTLYLVGLPKEAKRAQGHGVTVRVFPVGTVDVSASGDSEGAIVAGTSNNVAWPNGQASAAAEGWIQPGSTGIIFVAAGGDCIVNVTA